MNNLIKNMSLSVLLTVSPSCIASIVCMYNTPVLAADGFGLSLLANSAGEFQESNKRQATSSGSTSKKRQRINVHKESAVSGGNLSSLDQGLRLEEIRGKVVGKVFNPANGAQNCLECSVCFANYILSNGKQCESADSSSAPDENITIHNETTATILSTTANDVLGEATTDLSHTSPVVDLTDQNIVLNSKELGSLHDFLSKQLNSDDKSYVVGLLYMEYNPEYKEKHKINNIDGHYMNYLVLGGQLWYVDVQVGTMTSELDISPFENAFYKTFRPNFLYVKKESGLASSCSSSSSSPSIAAMTLKEEPGASPKAYGLTDFSKIFS